MGSALSRCTSRNSPGAATTGFSEMGQKILDRQPNWLIPPSKWRSQACSHRPVRYRTPTPYPKDDRKPLEDDVTRSCAVHIPEKALIIETPVVIHHEVHCSEKPLALAQPPKPRLEKPQAPLAITWEVSPRLNRFERAVA